jgi:hypothetical protein
MKMITLKGPNPIALNKLQRKRERESSDTTVDPLIFTVSPKVCIAISVLF